MVLVQERKWYPDWGDNLLSPLLRSEGYDFLLGLGRHGIDSLRGN